MLPANGAREFGRGYHGRTSGPARAARRDDEAARLEREVQTAEARVGKVTEALARIGYSEPLAAKLRAEEARLLDARKALAAMARAVKPSTPPPTFSREAVLAVVENLAAAVLAKQ